MRNNATLADVAFRFIECSEDFEFFLEILIRRVFRERSECLKSLLLWRHTGRMNRFWELARLRFADDEGQRHEVVERRGTKSAAPDPLL